MSVHGLYRMDPNNIGDWVCSPLDYFDFGVSTRSDIYLNWNGKADLVVIGGGGVFPAWSSKIRPHARRGVVWGAGSNLSPSDPRSLYPLWLKEFRLVGVRDWGCGHQWAPCASCMSPLFDRQYAVRHSVVSYMHKDRPSPVHPGLCLTNACTDFEAVVNFLGSAETVVTNTYHGVYWVTLLGRKVVLTERWSTKFLHFKHPVVDMGDSLKRALKKAVAYPNALKECRDANREFYWKVKALLGGK